jgi:hypothetical protein
VTRFLSSHSDGMGHPVARSLNGCWLEDGDINVKDETRNQGVQEEEARVTIRNNKKNQHMFGNHMTIFI